MRDANLGGDEADQAMWLRGTSLPASCIEDRDYLSDLLRYILSIRPVDRNGDVD
jgi:hypothetical protein